MTIRKPNDQKEAHLLKQIVIENYRSCLRTSINLNPQLSVLIGPNGSGKTNILQGIMFLHKLAREREHFGRRRDAITVSSRLKAVFEQRNTRIQLNASISAYTEESNYDVMLSSTEKWQLKGKKHEQFSAEMPLPVAAQMANDRTSGRFYWHVHLHSRYLKTRPVRRTELPKWVRLPLSKVADYCRGIRYYGASQFTNPGSCPVSFEIEQEGEQRRLFRGRGHVKILYDMYSSSRIQTNSRYSQFIDIVGPKGLRLVDELTFREVKTSSTDYSVRVGGKVEVRKRHKLLVIPQFRIGRQKLSPNQLSEGTFKTLALLFHVITESSTALLIEEPEVCIHHGLLSSILELINSYSRHKQMILSTHSDYVLDHVKPENVFAVRLEGAAGTAVRQITSTMKAKELAALHQYLDQVGNLGEYWREGGLGDQP